MEYNLIKRLVQRFIQPVQIKRLFINMRVVNEKSPAEFPFNFHTRPEIFLGIATDAINSRPSRRKVTQNGDLPFSHNYTVNSALSASSSIVDSTNCSNTFSLYTYGLFIFAGSYGLG